MRKFALTTILVLLATACSGVKVREEAGVRAALVAWPDVRADVLYGLEVQAKAGLDPAEVEIARRSVDDLEAALKSGDRRALLVAAWLPLEQLAIAGYREQIAKGELGENSARSLVERLNQFGQLLRKLAERT